MINITITADEIHIRGHAEAGPKGQDIVCSAISTLTQNLIASLEELTNDKIQYAVNPGRVDINYKDLSKQGRLLVESFFLGCSGVAAVSPEHVKVTRHECPKTL